MAPSFPIMSGGEMPPDRRTERRGTTQYPFDELAVGQWFPVLHAKEKAVRAAISRWYRHHGRAKEFRQRFDTDGHPTVWRVK